jgi:catechol 2,3-dioxygenase-like lactoylglutathione lyase family enzyme
MTDEAPAFDGINLVVADMEASVAFYRRLGISIPDQGPWDVDHRTAETAGGASFEMDSTTFVPRWNSGWPGTQGRGSVVFGFKVANREDVDRIHDDLTSAGYTSQQAPYDAFWGSRYAIVEDPDGNAVGLMSPMDDAFRSDTPAF